MKSVWTFALFFVTIASADFGRLTINADEAPMADMKTGHAASRAAGMTEMMGAPGLLPFDVMTGQAGQWMVGYQFMYEKLSGNLDGASNISEGGILERFSTSPTDMAMQMHMGMIMFAPTNRLTLMAMLPYVRMSMGELHRDGTRSTERSSGIGDLELRGTYSLYAPKNLRHRILANFGVGLPTGSINRQDAQGMPVVLGDVSQRCRDAPLRGHRVGAGGEHFG